MSIAKLGINQIVWCKKGTLATTPTNINAIGNKPDCALDFEPFRVQNTDRGNELWGWINMTGDNLKSNQPNLKFLSDIITVYAADGGCDMEVLSTPQSSGVDGGCLQFKGASSQHVGLDFEYIWKPDERTILLLPELALPDVDMNALIDGSDAATPGTFSLSNRGIDFAKQRHFWLNTFDSTFTAADGLLDFSFSAKSESTKEKIYNRGMMDYIVYKIEITLRAATVANMVSIIAKGKAPALTIQQDTSISGTTFEKFVFGAGVLSLSPKFKAPGTKDRFSKLVYMGKVPLGNHSFSFTTPNGGGTSADGSEGGTVTVSL